MCGHGPRPRTTASNRTGPYQCTKLWLGHCSVVMSPPRYLQAFFILHNTNYTIFFCWRQVVMSHLSQIEMSYPPGANPGMLAVSRLSETGNCCAEEDDRQVSRLEVETTNRHCCSGAHAHAVTERSWRIGDDSVVVLKAIEYLCFFRVALSDLNDSLDSFSIFDDKRAPVIAAAE